jgi:hypothetical protein
VKVPNPNQRSQEEERRDFRLKIEEDPNKRKR